MQLIDNSAVAARIAIGVPERDLKTCLIGNMFLLRKKKSPMIAELLRRIPPPRFCPLRDCEIPGFVSAMQMLEHGL